MSRPVQDACLRPYEPPEQEPLTRLPREGEKVRLCVGGPVLVVVDVPVPNLFKVDFMEEPPDGPPFGASIGCIYVDKQDHVTHCVVPFGSLRSSRER
jgi:hypothetical protein